MCSYSNKMNPEKKESSLGHLFSFQDSPTGRGCPEVAPAFMVHNILSPGLIPRLKVGRIMPLNTLNPLRLMP